jgi:hypothetical protein
MSVSEIFSPTLRLPDRTDNTDEGAGVDALRLAKDDVD